MKRMSKCLQSKALLAMLTGGMMLQFGGCNLGTVSAGASVELSTRDILLSLVRGWVIDPIDTFVTDRVNALFDNLEGE